MEGLFIPVVLGTAREGRASEKVARLVFAEAEKYGFKTEFVDIASAGYARTLAPWEDHPESNPWKALALRADGFIVVTPEYNHGIPGELKMFLDSAYKEYEKKPFALCGVSSGQVGGARAIEMLRLVVAEYHALATRAALYFPHTGEDGSIPAAADENFGERIKTLFDELRWYATVLKEGKDKYPLK